ncbi:MAG: thioredoxin [gamma proteobacterium symbiont of Bathyaustriella thionipta]|nr:thioredoxin [gamma proteobacterium symbiont of Bathyaustriella thionipta]
MNMPRHPSSKGRIYDVCEADFEQRVIQASQQQPVLVDFWAEWCSPCLMLAPSLERVVCEWPQEICLAKLEVDDNMRLAGKYKVRGFPSVLLFVAGEEIARFVSAKPVHWIEEFLQNNLGV